MSFMILFFLVICLNKLVVGQLPDHKCGTESGNREYNIDAGLFYWDRGLERRSAEYAVITESGRVYVTEYEPIITSRHRLRLFVHNTKSFKTIPEYIISQTKCNNQRILGEWKRVSSGYVIPESFYERELILNQNIPNKDKHKRLKIITMTSDSGEWKTGCRNGGSYGYSVKSTLFHVGQEQESITVGFKSNNMKFYDNGHKPTEITEVELVDMAPDAMLNLHGTQQIASMDPVKSVIVLFFGPFYLTTNNIILNSTTSFRKMIQKQEIHFNSRWIGCPEDFCYEFNIDAAYSVDDKEIILMSGMNDYSIDQWPPRRPPTLVEKRKWPKGGKYGEDESSFMVPVFAFGFKNNAPIYASRGYLYEGETNQTKRMYIKITELGRKDIFHEDDPNRYLPIAAVIINNEIVYFNDDPVNITLKNSSGEYIPRNVKGSDIDAAFSYNQSVVIIAGNYYYNISMNDINDGNMFSGPFPIFSKEYLLKAGCSNKKYSKNSNFKKYLNVSSRSEFYYFVNRFIQVPSFRPEIPKRQTLTRTTSTTTEEPDVTSRLHPTITTAETSSKGLFIILILLVVTAIFILGVIIAFLFKYK